MKRIYVAGPYSSDNVLGVMNNIREGVKACSWLVSAGYAVFCPWLDHQYAFYEPGITVEQYRANSLAWLEVSDVLLVLPGWRTSKGTMAEIARAGSLRLPTIYIDDVGWGKTFRLAMVVVSRSKA